MLRPQFEKSQVSAIDQFEPYVQKLISCIPAGETVDLQELFHKFTMDTSTDFLMGTGTDCLGGDKAADKFAVTFDQCLMDGIWKDMLGPFWYLTPHKKGAEAIKYAHRAVEGWVKQAMQIKSSADFSEKTKGKGERYVFVNELARHEEVDATRIRDEALNIILAGRDTTASLLSNLWFVLAKEPAVYKKLRAEVDELNGEQPSYETLRNMKYIKYTVQESKHQPTTTIFQRSSLTLNQPSAFFPQSPSSANSPSKTPSSPTAAAKTASNPSSSPKATA